MKKQGNPANLPLKSERGSAIIWIFIMIALFGMVSFVMSQGSRTGASSISSEQAKLQASNIIEQGATIRRVVHELRINGCSDTQISFESAATGTEYENPNAPNDKRCNVFHPDGGGLKLVSVDNADYEGFCGISSLPGIGTTCADTSCADLYWVITLRDRSLCKQLNASLGYTDIPEPLSLDFAFGRTPFTGIYGSALRDDGTVYEGKPMGCYEWAGDPDFYVYYHTLLAR